MLKRITTWLARQANERIRERENCRRMEQLRRWLLEENMRELRELRTLVCSDGKQL